MTMIKQSMKCLHSEDWEIVTKAYKELKNYTKETLIQNLKEYYPKLSQCSFNWNEPLKITAGIHGHGVSYYDGEYTTASGRELCIFEEQEVLNAGVYLYTDEKDYLVKFMQVVRSKYWDTAFWSGDAEFFPGNVGPSEALYFYNPVNQSIVHVESFDNPESLESTRIDPFATYMEGSLDPHVIIHQPDITVEEKWIPKTFSELQGFLLVMALLKDIDIDIQVLVELPNQDLKKRYLHQLLLSRAKHAYSNIPTEQWSLQLGNY